MNVGDIKKWVAAFEDAAEDVDDCEIVVFVTPLNCKVRCSNLYVDMTTKELVIVL